VVNSNQKIIGLENNNICLTFNEDKDFKNDKIQYISKKIVIGNCRMNNKNLEKVVKYKVILPSENEIEFNCSFKCKVMKPNELDEEDFIGDKLPIEKTINSGEEITLKFGFNPPD